MKAVAVHRGSRDGYQVARALSEAGLLEKLVTDLYWPADRAWARGIEEMVPARFSAELRRRNAEGLLSHSVEACWMSGLTAYLANEQHWLPFNGARDTVRWCDRHLGRRAGRLATEKGAAILSYSYYGHSAFSEYRGERPRILFQLHPHPSAVRTILRQERHLHPDCASSLDKEWELALPEEDYRRLVEECSLAEYWIAASTFTKNTLVSEGVPGDKVAIVPYGIDSSRYVFPRKPARAKGEALRLLFVGTLGQRKGIKYLIEALNLLEPGKVELTVCGRPVDDLRIFQQSRIPIQLCPAATPARLLEAYRNADVFVFPSVAEGFAQVLLEAMASGLPVVATTRTAAPDLIRHGREGFVIEPGSASALAMKIEEFLRRPELVRAMGEAARLRAEYFTWRRFREGIAAFVGGALNGGADLHTAKSCLPC